MEVLYGAMSDEAQRLMVKEFFHCYCPNEIAQSKGRYSFMPKSPLLRLICETPDSKGIERVGIFSWKGMNGCVILVTLIICPST